jgi:hypothetical protein
MAGVPANKMAWKGAGAKSKIFVMICPTCNNVKKHANGCKTAKMLRNQLAKLLKYLAANPTYQVKSYAHDEELVEHVKNLKARL